MGLARERSEILDRFILEQYALKNKTHVLRGKARSGAFGWDIRVPWKSSISGKTPGPETEKEAQKTEMAPQEAWQQKTWICHRHRTPKNFSLTSINAGFNIILIDCPTPPGSLNPFLEEVMRWAYREYIGSCLPEAEVLGRRTKPTTIFHRAKPVDTRTVNRRLSSMVGAGSRSAVLLIRAMRSSCDKTKAL